jgi:hypothetical protein
VLKISKLIIIFAKTKQKQLTMKRVILSLLVAIFAMGISFEAMAWGGSGHSAATYIAEKNLTTTAKTEIRKYLPHTITYYASWMDAYRCTIPYEALDWWHNVAVDRNFNIVELDGHSGYVQSARIIEEMKDYKNLPDSVVALNVKLLVHMVVDMHCPGHNRYLVPPFDWQNPNNDPNNVPILTQRFKYNGKRMSYHGMWDRSPAIFHKDWTCEEFEENLNVLTPKQIKKVCKGTLKDWIMQCVKDNQLSYRYIVPGEDLAKIPQEQHDELVALIDQQIQYAGYRLAHVLNNIFDPAKGKSKK